jgi:hypothetical protein
MTSQPPAVGTAVYEVKITRSCPTDKTIPERSGTSSDLFHEVSTTQRPACCLPARFCLERFRVGAEAACRRFASIDLTEPPRFTGIEAFNKVSWGAPETFPEP